MSNQNNLFGIDPQDCFRCCKKCQQRKHLSEYHLCNFSKDGRRTKCKSCELELSQALRLKKKRTYIPRDPESLQRCAKCHMEKPAKLFRPHKTTSSGLRSRCKECERESVRIEKYGLDGPSFKRLFAKYDGRCHICGVQFPAMYQKKGQKQVHVDHCHKTGFVRGILCFSCNHGLGLFKDNPVLILKAYEYLLRNKRKCS